MQLFIRVGDDYVIEADYLKRVADIDNLPDKERSVDFDDASRWVVVADNLQELIAYLREQLEQLKEVKDGLLERTNHMCAIIHHIHNQDYKLALKCASDAIDTRDDHIKRLCAGPQYNEYFKKLERDRYDLSSDNYHLRRENEKIKSQLSETQIDNKKLRNHLDVVQKRAKDQIDKLRSLSNLADQKDEEIEKLEISIRQFNLICKKHNEIIADQSRTIDCLRTESKLRRNFSWKQATKLQKNRDDLYNQYRNEKKKVARRDARIKKLEIQLQAQNG